MSRTRDAAALQAHLDAHFAPATVSTLEWGATGASNDTLFFSVTGADGGEEKFVLRAQTGGHQLFYEVELLFQARVLEGLASSPELLAPEVVLIEEDKSICGSEFFVMRSVPGRNIPVVPSWMAEGWLKDSTPAQRETVWTNAVSMMGKVGRVDWRRDLGFLDDGRRGALGLDRCLGYVEDWFAWAAKGRPQPTSDVAMRYIREHQPMDAPVELVWGDATLMNMLHDPEDLSITAVIDWEMATLGPAELDLGWFLMMADMYSLGFGLPRLEGIPSREDTIAQFERTLGRPLSHDIHYYEILAALRMAIVTMRFADLQVQYGTLPPTTTLGTNNPATVVLAQYLGIDGIDNDSELDTANRAVARAERGGA